MSVLLYSEHLFTANIYNRHFPMIACFKQPWLGTHVMRNSNYCVNDTCACMCVCDGMEFKCNSFPRCVTFTQSFQREIPYHLFACFESSARVYCMYFINGLNPDHHRPQPSPFPPPYTRTNAHRLRLMLQWYQLERRDNTCGRKNIWYIYIYDMICACVWTDWMPKLMLSNTLEPHQYRHAVWKVCAYL